MITAIQRSKESSQNMSTVAIIPNHRFNDLVGALGKNFTTEQLLDAIIGSGNKQLLRIFTSSQPPATKNLKPGQIRCTAYKFQVILNEETGEFEPVQCDHACVNGATHCGQHERYSTRNGDATWKILGDLETGPGETFTDVNHPNYNEVRSNYYKSRGIVPPSNSSKQLAKVKTEKPTKLKAEPKQKTAAAPKLNTDKKAKQVKERKPTVNPFLKFLSKNRTSIRAECLAADESISGRDLQTAITTRAGEMWRSLGDEEKAAYKTQVEAVVVSGKTGVELIEEECDSEASTPKIKATVLPDPEPQADDEEDAEDDEEDDEVAEEEEEEEENSFVFHEKLKVFYDPMTSCYSAEKNTPVIGTIKSGKLVPFKR
jgi:hypothetical protein